MKEPHEYVADVEAAVHAFSEDLRSAIDLRVQFYGRELDVGPFSLGQRVLYAVDGNIINYFFKCDEDVFSLQLIRRNRNAFEIFRGNSELEVGGQEDILAYCLSRYLFYMLPDESGERLPLLLLPGHDIEARNAYDTIVRSLDESLTQKRMVREYVIDLLDKLNAMPEDDAKTYLEENRQDITKKSHAINDPHEKLFRYNKLLKHSRLMRLKRASFLKAFNDLKQEGSPHPFAVETVDDAIALTHAESSYDYWSKSLNSSITGKMLANDLDALTTLDLLNRRLRKRNVRVVLFTLNEKIIEVGRGYRPYIEDGGDYSQYTFTDLFIRHPVALLSAPEILQPGVPGVRESELSDWLELLLAQYTGYGRYTVNEFRSRLADKDDAEINDLARGALSEAPDTHTKLISDWVGHLDTLEQAHEMTSEIARLDIVELIGESNRDKATVLERLDDHIVGLVEDSWDDFFETAYEAGYELIDMGNRDASIPRRNVPPLVFRLKDGPASQFMKSINRANGLAETEAIVEDLLEAIDEDDREKSNYLRLLCYGLLFAYTERWYVTRLLAQRAIYYAKKVAPKELTAINRQEWNFVSGREAYYLRALAGKLTARSDRELNKIRELLREGLRRQRDIDRLFEKHREPDDKNVVQLTGLRFEAELVSVDLAEVLFRNYPASGKRINEKELHSKLESIYTNAKAAMKSAPDCSEKWVREYVEINLRSNIFMVAALAEERGLKSLASDDELRGYFAAQTEQLISAYGTNHGTRIFASALDVILVVYLAARLGIPKSEFQLFYNEYTQIKRNMGNRPDWVAITPYDRRRFKSLVSMIETREKLH